MDKTLAALPGTVDALNELDDYMRYKKLEKQMEHLDVMEDYIKLETRNLEKELLHAQEEVLVLYLALFSRYFVFR